MNNYVVEAKNRRLLLKLEDDMAVKESASHTSSKLVQVHCHKHHRHRSILVVSLHLSVSLNFIMAFVACAHWMAAIPTVSHSVSSLPSPGLSTLQDGQTCYLGPPYKNAVSERVERLHRPPASARNHSAARGSDGADLWREGLMLVDGTPPKRPIAPFQTLSLSNISIPPVMDCDWQPNGASLLHNW